MNKASAINFSLAALNFGLMIFALRHNGWSWCVSLASSVFCFCMGLVCLDKKGK